MGLSRECWRVFNSFYNAMSRRNIIGSAVIKRRFDLGWTQETLAARMQCHGYDVSREMVSNVESGRTRASDYFLMGLQIAFGEQIINFFPKAVQELDATFAERAKFRPLKKTASIRTLK